MCRGGEPHGGRRRKWEVVLLPGGAGVSTYRDSREIAHATWLKVKIKLTLSSLWECDDRLTRSVRSKMPLVHFLPPLRRVPICAFPLHRSDYACSALYAATILTHIEQKGEPLPRSYGQQNGPSAPSGAA